MDRKTLSTFLMFAGTDEIKSRYKIVPFMAIIPNTGWEKARLPVGPLFLGFAVKRLRFMPIVIIIRGPHGLSMSERTASRRVIGPDFESTILLEATPSGFDHG